MPNQVRKWKARLIEIKEDWKVDFKETSALMGEERCKELVHEFIKNGIAPDRQIYAVGCTKTNTCLACTSVLLV